MKIRRAWLMGGCVVVIIAIVAGLRVQDARAGKASARGRIFVLIVWDGLRPDSVDAVNTPNLFALENAGVRFARHHSIYPTLTMVNAAGLATGASPSRSGIYGDMMYLPPVLDMARASTIPNLGVLLGDPLNLERSTRPRRPSDGSWHHREGSRASRGIRRCVRQARTNAPV
jgi:hypothetical protein